MFYTPIQAMGKTLESSMSIEKNDIKQGEETSITLKINSEEQINAFQAKLSYDEDIWEEIDENNFVVDDGWEGLKYNKDNKEFIVVNKKEKTNKEILKVNFKAKNSAKEGNTEIKIEGIKASDGKVEFENENLSNEILIKINESLIEKPTDPTEPSKPSEPTTPEIPSRPENTIENITGDVTNSTEENITSGNTIGNTIENNQQNNIINSNKNNSTNEIKDTNKTEENLPEIFPKTGASRTILIVIVILSILAIILYYKNKKYSKIMMMLIICGTLISQGTVFAASEIFLGDINQSSVIDDEDIEIMEEYLIKSKDVTSLEQADMNIDGKLSIIDLSLLIQQQKECPYDKNNVTNITSWSAVPMVSKELLQKQ